MKKKQAQGGDGNDMSEGDDCIWESSVWIQIRSWILEVQLVTSSLIKKMRLQCQIAGTENNFALLYEQQVTPSATAREGCQKYEVYRGGGILCQTSPWPAVSCSAPLTDRAVPGREVRQLPFPGSKSKP